LRGLIIYYLPLPVPLCPNLREKQFKIVTRLVLFAIYQKPPGYDCRISVNSDFQIFGGFGLNIITAGFNFTYGLSFVDDSAGAFHAREMDLLRHVENWAAPFVLIMTAILLAWILYQAGGVGFLLDEPGKFQTAGEFWKIFIPSLTAMIGFWATLSLNMPDFTRFGKSQREQVVGQTVALPTTMVIFAAMGILITSAAVVVFPQMKPDELWDPVKLVGQFSQPLVVAISMFTIIVATLSVNIAANVVSPANDFANAFPKWISFRTGGLITGIVGILMQPWKLLADPSGYIFSWLLGYSGGLGSIAGVLIADYWIIRNKNLNLGDLYRTKGVYRYASGWNWRAVVATILGCFFAWIGLIIPTLRLLYDYAWFVGFGVSFFMHWVLMKAIPPQEFSPVRQPDTL
jgi:NCS1 family nucleobase:cation symporter-1